MKNYFASFIPAVKAILGIEAWSKDPLHTVYSIPFHSC